MGDNELVSRKLCFVVKNEKDGKKLWKYLKKNKKTLEEIAKNQGTKIDKFEMESKLIKKAGFSIGIISTKEKDNLVRKVLVFIPGLKKSQMLGVYNMCVAGAEGSLDLSQGLNDEVLDRAREMVETVFANLLGVRLQY